MKLVKNSGYTGYVGVEYEGNRLSEKEGIMAIKELLLKSAKTLN
jgi:hydroxypyruvate isomerase